MKDKRYKTLVIDDENFCIDNLKQSISCFPELYLVGEATSAKEGKKIILRTKPDLLFLDIELPDMSGIELLHELRNLISWNMQVVFYTSYQKYWLDALRESAFDYLLKPYDKNEFILVVSRFLQQVDKRESLHSFYDSLSELLPANQLFMISTITGYQILRINQIGYFDYTKSQRQWIVYLESGKQVLMKRNTTADDILKYSSTFVQINQHQIININHLCSIKNKTCCLLPPFENTGNLIISRKFFNNLRDSFFLL
jgi:two-component system LytT family response regulator